MTRMTRLSCVSVLATAALTLIGCGGQARSYFPLDEGETWTYQMSSSSLPNGHVTITATNLAKRGLSGKSVTPAKIDFNGQTIFSFYGEDSNGVFELAIQTPHNAEPVMRVPPRYFLHRPYSEGTAWDLPYETQTLANAIVPITLRATIQSSNETVTVPAGTFERCLKVMARADAIKYIRGFNSYLRIQVDELSWYCPGVGLAKSITKEAGADLAIGNGEISVQLESHGRAH
jgi:hypothetical protein